MAITHSAVKNSKYWIGRFIGSHPLFFECLAFLPQFRERLISSQTDICIEGFPRSANSFAHEVFRLYNPEAKCAHHIHAPMQVVKAVKLGIPCIVLIRNPIDAVTSVLIVDRALSKDVALKSYINFYKRIWNLRKKVVVAEFEEVTKDLCKIILSVNERYGTSFQISEIGPLEREAIFRIIDEGHKRQKLPTSLTPLPTEPKKRIKEEVILELKKRPLLEQAESLYRDFLESSS